MFNTKFRYLFIIIPVLLIVGLGGYALFKRYERQQKYERRASNDVIVGKERTESQGEKKILQSIIYSNPIVIPQYESFIIEVYPQILDEARTQNREQDEATEYGYTSKNIRKYENTKRPINLLFLDNDFGYQRTLLDKKALILDMKMPHEHFSKPNQEGKEDSLQTKAYQQQVRNFPYLLYKIVFEDTNKDGLINQKDAEGFYISNIDGTNLKGIGKNILVTEFELQYEKKRLFLTYFERSKAGLQKQKKFAFYYIENHQFKPLDGIQKALKDAEKILTQ